MTTIGSLRVDADFGGKHEHPPRPPLFAIATIKPGPDYDEFLKLLQEESRKKQDELNAMVAEQVAKAAERGVNITHAKLVGLDLPQLLLMASESVVVRIHLLGPP